MRRLMIALWALIFASCGGGEQQQRQQNGTARIAPAKGSRPAARSSSAAERKAPAEPGEAGPGDEVMRGKAAWYGGKHHNGPTASGERFNKNALTAAHRTLPFNTVVRVTNRKNGRTVEVRINDRGPFGKRERIIDLSEAAARKLDMIRSGVVPVTVEVVERPTN